MKPKYQATITFETDGKTDLSNLLEQVADRMEQVFSVSVVDTHVEEYNDDQTTASDA